MNAIIKPGSGAFVRAGAGSDVKPIDLTPIVPLFEGDYDQNLDPSQIRDPKVRAELEARAIIRAAQEEADGIRQEGHDEGFREGAQQAAEQVSELVDRLERDLRAVAADRAETLTAIEPQVLKLCMEIVEKVIRHEAKTDPRVVMRAIKSCLRRVKDGERISVRVSPDEVEEVRARRDKLAGLAQGCRELDIVDDRRVAVGGCIVESQAGVFDATIESQTAKIETKLRETLENEQLRPETGEQ